jgi:ankyrin repeat protein
MKFINKVLNMLPDFDFTDDKGNTILHQAVIDNDFNMVQMLLNKMIDSDKNIINIQNSDGNTAFHLSLFNENNQIAQLLDKGGADKTIRNNEGEFVENVTEEEDLEIVNFKFNPIKCTNKKPNDLVNILKLLSQLNPIKNVIVENYDSDSNIEYQSQSDPILDNLLNNYIMQKRGINKFRYKA